MGDQKYADALAAGTILGGKYMLECPIGRGGFGITYRGKTLPLPGAEVAIKEFFPQAIYTRGPGGKLILLPGREKELARWSENYERECGLMSALRGNRAIAHVRETFQDPVTCTQYLVMDFISGETLEKRVQGGSVLSGAEVEGYLKPFLPELARMHRTGILHRDINPGNLMLSDQGLKLIDFGSAREVPRKGGKLTTLLRPGFAPPEQYDSHGAQGPTTDVYALCASLYYALSGVVPPDGKLRMLRDDLEPLDKMPQVRASRELIRVISRGMSLPLEERPAGFDEMYRLIFGEDRPGASEAPQIGHAAPLPPPRLITPPPAASLPPAHGMAPPSAKSRTASRADAAARAGKYMRRFRGEKYEIFLKELDQIARMPDPASRRVALEDAIWKNGKAFALLVDWLTA